MADAAGRILAVLGAVADRSTGSDELARSVQPGWDEYHLGGAGANVIRPLGICPDDRVLVWPAGSGVVVRHAADVGAGVVGVESDPGWLEAARLRTEGCAGVELLAEPPESRRDFDLVIIAASPEHTPLRSGQNPPPRWISTGSAALEAILSSVEGYLDEGGVVAVAVPGAVSVAQLAGFELPDLAGVATGASQSGLESSFVAAGLERPLVAACYPDVFGTTAVLTEAAFVAPDAVDLVDQIVGAPVAGRLGEPLVLADDRAVLRALTAAGAGLATSPGLLAVAGRRAGDAERRLGRSVLAWRYTGGRRRVFQQEMTVVDTGGARTVVRRPMFDAPDPGGAAWLFHSLTEEQPYAVGPTIEQLSLAALGEGDLGGLESLLGLWAAELSALVDDRPNVPPHPFLAAGASRVLPGDCLDVGLDNFTASEAGIVFVDREWRCEGGVDLDLAATRALWKVAVSTVRNGSRHPWPASTTVGQIWAELVDLSPFELGQASLEAWWVAEGQLQAVVGAADPDSVTEELRAVSGRSRLMRARYPVGVEAAGAVRDLDDQVRRLTDQLQAAHGRIGDLETERAALSERLEELRAMAPVRVARAAKHSLEKLRRSP